MGKCPDPRPSRPRGAGIRPGRDYDAGSQALHQLDLVRAWETP